MSIVAAFVVGGVCVSIGRACAGDDADVGAWTANALAKARDAWLYDNVQRMIFFSGGDIARNGAFAHAGLLWSPGGLANDGFILKTAFATGIYSYKSGDTRIIGKETAAQVLPGWRFKVDQLEIKVFGGLDIDSHRLTPDDPSSRLHGSATGGRIAAEIWYEPTSATMLAADGSLSSIDTNHSARLAFGWRLFDAFYAGPETQLFGCEGYRQLRFGAHLTALKFDNTEWSAAAGWAESSDRRSSLYLRVGMLLRQF